MHTKSNKYKPPAYRSRSFHCPHCGVFAEQHWEVLLYKEFILNQGMPAIIDGKKAEYSVCQYCKHPTLWSASNLVYPSLGGYPPPNDDLPDEVKKLYVEAGSVAQLSPRSCCALLRLALQELLIQLGESGKINSAIESLDQQGLDSRIKEALHTVRVIGNQAVHPGKIDFDEFIDTNVLFELLNAIARDRITMPRERAEMYDKLPKGDRDFIEQKDKKSKERKHQNQS